MNTIVNKSHPIWAINEAEFNFQKFHSSLVTGFRCNLINFENGVSSVEKQQFNKPVQKQNIKYIGHSCWRFRLNQY